MGHIVIEDRFISELGLKGNELLIYSLIYGYSQGKQGCFYGSLKNLAGRLKINPDTVRVVLNSLVEKGLLEKTELTIGNVKRCEYSANIDHAENPCGYAENPCGGTRKFRVNIITNNIDNNNTLPNKRTREEVISEKKATFRETVAPFISKYGQSLIDDFCDYWAVPLQGKDRLLWEDQKTWDVEARLRTWAKKEQQYAASRPVRQQAWGPRVNERGETVQVEAMRKRDEALARAAAMMTQGENYDELEELGI